MQEHKFYLKHAFVMIFLRNSDLYIWIYHMIHITVVQTSDQIAELSIFQSNIFNGLNLFSRLTISWLLLDALGSLFCAPSMKGVG